MPGIVRWPRSSTPAWCRGVITQNVDLLHTKAGSRDVVNLHGTYAEVICLDCGHTMTRAALAELLEAANPGFVERAEAVGGIAVAPDADAVVGDTRRSRSSIARAAVACSSPTSSTSARACRKTLWRRRIRLVDEADALLVAGSSLTVFSGFRFVRHAAALGIPVAIINRGRTRGDDLATVKIDSGCSPLLALLADELPSRVFGACMRNRSALISC